MHCFKPGHLANHLTKEMLKSTVAIATLVSATTENEFGGLCSAGTELYKLTLGSKTEILIH